MIQLALIGKNIQHSQSKSVYEMLLSREVHYTLIDKQSADLIPTIDDLKQTFNGVSITAPYKTHFIKTVDEVDLPEGLEAINCLIFKKNKTIGTNTDYLALLELIPTFVKNFESIGILGDGAISQTTCLALENLEISYKIYSRKKGNLSSLNFEKPTLIINCCARDYIFKGPIPPKSVFWDLNYNHQLNQSAIQEMNIEYVDGKNLLIAQAKHALRLWHIN